MAEPAAGSQPLPTVYAWKAGLFAGGPDEVWFAMCEDGEVWFAMCEDGEVLASHVSSSRRFGPGDVHLTFGGRRAVYEAKFGGIGEEFYRFVVLPDGEKPPPEAWEANKRWAAARDAEKPPAPRVRWQASNCDHSEDSDSQRTT